MAELLFVPLKKSSDVDIVKPLKNLLQSTYNSGETHENFSDALNELSRLRANAIWKVFETSSLDVIYSYHDQLASLESKVPPQDVQIPFKWKDAFDKGSIFGGRMSLTVSSLAYERLCVLYNAGAAQSALAAQQPLDTEDSLKLAAKLLQQAAGTFSYIRGRVGSALHCEPTPDLSPDTLDALSKLMLAQAQEVIAYKCIRDEMKEGMVAKVCAAGEDMYTEALRGMQREAQRGLWERDWVPAAAAKQGALRGLAHLYQAGAARAAGAYGEEIARLRLAAEALRGAALPLLADAAARAQRRLAAAVKDNDFIYHERVPEPAALDPVPRAHIAKPLPPPDRYTNDRDLFLSLTPVAVSGALSAAAARRGELVAAEVGRLRAATQQLNAVLAELSLPACVERAPPGGLPASIREKARAVRAAGGAAALTKLMDDLPELLQRNRDILNEAERMVREEEESDAALRAQFGARWARTESARLTEGFRANGNKYRQIIDNAVRADDIVRDKYTQHKQNIELLSSPEEAVEDGVPAGGAGGEAGGEAGGTLRALCADVEALKAARDALEADLKDVTVDMKERFLAALADTGAVDEPALSAAALGAALAPLQRRVRDSLGAQEALVARVRAAHAALEPRACHARDAKLGALAAAHDAYQELTANLTEGTKFYNDLTQLLVAYQSKVEDFCFARRTEKEELLKDLTQEASRPTPAPAPRPAPPPPPAAAADQPAAPPRAEPPARPPPPAAQAGPAAGALPYPAGPGGMPLPYGAAPYQYYAAPMPALYNPYATLPYPHHARLPPAQPYSPYQHPPAAPHYPAAPPPGYNPYPQQ